MPAVPRATLACRGGLLIANERIERHDSQVTPAHNLLEERPMTTTAHVVPEQCVTATPQHRAQFSRLLADLHRPRPGRHGGRLGQHLFRRAADALMDGVRAVAAPGGRSARSGADVAGNAPRHDALPYTERLEWLYDHLADEHSRLQLVSLVGASICGPTPGRPG